MNPAALIPEDFRAVPGLDALDGLTVSVGTAPDDVQAIGYTVFTDGEVPAGLGLDREALERAGFEPKVGKTLLLPQATGPELVAVGAGDGELGHDDLRDLAASLVRVTARQASIALVVGRPVVDVVGTAQALTEGAALARYRYSVLKKDVPDAPLTSLTLDLIEADPAEVAAGEAAALVTTRATVVARDLANTPPAHLTATAMGEVAVELGARFGFEVELFDKAALIELGCGGLLGVNQGSAEEPRLIKLSYRPTDPTGHLGLIGKGIMYDSGGISLKPSDPMHLLMKMDMGGAAAVLGAFTGLRDAGVTAAVTGWLCCTDNMPSGTAYKLGDVLTARGGTTIEVKNTDAEGRLAMCDSFVLAREEGVDAIVDIATLTGAALMALGQITAPVFANDQRMADLALASSAKVGEQLWQLPLERRYRPQLDSAIADISNLGGPFAGATTAALFLDHFTDGVPWAHIDIAGTMQSDKDDSWRSAGATGFGARLLLDLAGAFTP